MGSLMFNPAGQVTLIITSQEQVVSAVAGIKCTPPVYILLTSRHLLEVEHSLTLQVSPGYGEEKRLPSRHRNAYFESSSLVVFRYHIRLHRKGTGMMIQERFSPLQFMAFLPLHIQNRVWLLVFHSATILDKCLL